MKIRALLLYFVVLTVACNTSKEKSLNDFMVATWQTSYIKIEMPSANGKDTIQVYEDDFSKEKATLAQSKYHKDGTFTAWYLMPDGKKVGETTGKWQTKGDSLFVEYTLQGKTAKPSYLVTQTENGFEAKSIYDWDGDGQKDDTLLMKSKRIQLK